MKLLHVVGARPNFPKLAPVHAAARTAGWQQVILHTGQHYDDSLSGSLFRDLDIPLPDINLEVGSATHAVQTARIMERLEPVLVQQAPDWMLVYGDVNSTLAASVVAAKLGVRIAHVEAGLRSGDRSMPEEINRLVTDRLSDLLLTPSRDADERLRQEGEPEKKIAFVGNVMIDTLFRTIESGRGGGFRRSLGIDGDCVVVTLHRPSNVDVPDRLRRLTLALAEIARERPVVFAVHPRTRQRLAEERLDMPDIRLLDPVGYPDMVDLVRGAYAVVTDSGGLQEETTALGIPCLTIRANTERPITITQGTNRLVPDPADLPDVIRGLRRPATPPRPEGWDGRAGERVVAAIRAATEE